MKNISRKSQKSPSKVKIGITHGDFNGIGYEIILKAFSDTRMFENYIPVIYGVSKIASYHNKTIGAKNLSLNIIRNAGQAAYKKMNIVNVYQEEVKIELGKSSEKAGELAYLALEEAVRDLRSKKIDVLVTAPINKHNIHSDQFNFHGHTEYLANAFGSDNYLMLMVSDMMRLGVVTGHIPLKDVPGTISKELILSKLGVMQDSLVRDFGIIKPKIALLGLNPHAGDMGLLGKEENEVIKPAVEEAVKNDMLVYGPYPADGFFATGMYNKFDGVMAMYHDQGLVPFKALAFDQGVNYTAGLPIIRTSPAHGTAYEIAGKNQASSESLREAVYLAADIYNNREEHEELTEKPLENYLDKMESSGPPNNHTERQPQKPEEEKENEEKA